MPHSVDFDGGEILTDAGLLAIRGLPELHHVRGVDAAAHKAQEGGQGKQA